MKTGKGREETKKSEEYPDATGKRALALFGAGDA
jgi:hypothetical protein